MRPQVDDTTADVVEELANELTEIEIEMLTFDQQLRVVLRQMDEIKFKKRSGSQRRLTTAGKIVSMLDADRGPLD